MIYYPISALLNAITSTILCVVVITRNPKSYLNRSFAYFAGSVAFWSYFYFLWQISKSSEAALLWCRVLMAGAIFIPSTFLHFSVTLIGQREKYLKTVIFWYIVSIIFLITDFTPLFVQDIRPRLSFSFWPTAGLAYGPFLAMFVGLTVYAHILMYKSYRRLSGFEKNQIKYVFLGTAIGFIGGSTNYPLWYDVPIPPIGNALVAVYVFTVAYAISKYRLMDIRVTIVRMAIFVVTYSGIFFVTILFSTLLKSELIRIAGDKWWIFPAVVYTVCVTLAPFVYQKLQSRAESRILKEQRDAHSRIETAARSITLIRDLDHLLNNTVRMLTMTLGITHASVFLFDRNTKQYTFRVARFGNENGVRIDLGNSLVKYLQNVRKPLIFEEVKRQYEERRDVFIREIRDTMKRLSADLLVPSYIHDELIGFLVLGNKRSGEVYTTDDLNVLSDLANQSALAIENAQFLKEREEMQGKLREAETLTTIRDLLGSFNHELYNLLTPIATTLQKITMGDYEKRPERLKPDAQKSVDTTFFIKTYLGWVREYVESGNKIASYQLSELVNGGISYSKDKLEKQNIKTQLNINPKIFIVGYESLPLIFRHLVLHSIYGYGMEEGGTISIGARILEDGATVEITQLDTGHDLCEYIKEKSTMGGTKFAEKGKLGGVSYFIAQAVVSKHRGIFELEPTGGNGTKFKIRLPLDFNKISA